LETLRSGKKFWKMKGKALVNQIMVTEAELMASVGVEGE
ncbi:MAG: 3-hydroxyacyl-[acyl-carrier-protein] dehydratase FabZ, partial [Deltaproteobacteria bacterium]|nr:3-hydroxyacyl-[acyl-carrier-protein] dehydratase FabZ [Deltaproteobacteria bacterium]